MQVVRSWVLVIQNKIRGESSCLFRMKMGEERNMPCNNGPVFGFTICWDHGIEWRDKMHPSTIGNFFEAAPQKPWFCAWGDWLLSFHLPDAKAYGLLPRWIIPLIGKGSANRPPLHSDWVLQKSWIAYCLWRDGRILLIKVSVEQEMARKTLQYTCTPLV